MTRAVWCAQVLGILLDWAGPRSAALTGLVIETAGFIMLALIGKGGPWQARGGDSCWRATHNMDCGDAAQREQTFLAGSGRWGPRIS